MSDSMTQVLQTTLNVLVIEDEPRFRNFLIDQLTEMGCRAQGAASAERAQEMFAHDAPDIVFLDLHLPGTDGLSLLSQMRQRDPDMPVVIVTGVGSLAAAQQAIRHHVTDFLTKPCHLGEIESALDRARRALVTQRTKAPAPEKTTENPASSPIQPIADLERRAILDALKRHQGNRTAAAAELGISRRTLYNRLQQYKHQGEGRHEHPSP